MAPKKKPILPTAEEIALADALASAASAVADVNPDNLSTKLRGAVEHLDQIASTMELLRSEQPKMMVGYADELMKMLLDSGIEMEAAGTFVGRFFSSTMLARILGDVAAGNTEPVVAVAKKPRPKPAAADPAPETPVEEEAPAPAPKPRKRAAKKAAPKPAPPVETPAEIDDANDPYANRDVPDEVYYDAPAPAPAPAAPYDDF